MKLKQIHNIFARYFGLKNKPSSIHFHLAPVEGLFFKPKYRANILCICFNFIAVLFLFLSSPWGSVYRFCTVSFDSNWSRSPKIRHSFALVCRCGLADIRRYVILRTSDKKENYTRKKTTRTKDTQEKKWINNFVVTKGESSSLISLLRGGTRGRVQGVRTPSPPPEMKPSGLKFAF